MKTSCTKTVQLKTCTKSVEFLPVLRVEGVAEGGKGRRETGGGVKVMNSTWLHPGVLRTNAPLSASDHECFNGAFVT